MSAPLPDFVDLAIVGAGTAGAAAALFAARRGLRVVCVERRSLAKAGARWVNGVPLWVFDEVDLARPRAPELRGASERFHLIAGWAGPRVSLTSEVLVEVDMRLLCERLQRDAIEAGAIFIEGCRVEGLDGERLWTERGVIRCGAVVDASGLAGLNLLGARALDSSDLCVAAQEVRTCERDGAARFFADHGAALGETLCFSGVAGTYSILNLQVHGDRLSLLAGSIVDSGQSSGRALIERFVANHAWAGAREFGGARAIPIRRASERLARGRVTAIGDAACQVFPPHGSGIAPQLRAARLLADTLAAGKSVHDYAWSYQRRFGLDLAIHDLLRRFSQDSTLADVALLIESGVLSSASTLATLEQRRPPRPTLAELRALPGVIVGAPRLAARASTMVARASALALLYAACPRSPALVPAWAASVEACFSSLEGVGEGTKWRYSLPRRYR